MILITKPGLLTSVQDLGRYGYQKYGVIASGVMDQLAHRVANLLVGNPDNEPTIEITLLGPVIEFQEDALISLCGGDLSPTIDGNPIRTWRAVLVKKGSQLRFGQSKNGCRAYLAVAGGINVPTVMESSSTYLRAEIGGFQGRALKAGDQVSTGALNDISRSILKHLSFEDKGESFVEMDWSVATDLVPNFESPATVRVIRGRQYDLFSEESRSRFYSEPFTVTTQSDRMGYRLTGPHLELETPAEMISEAVNFGSIQVPSEGNPIVLLADRQTTGGYPKIGQIATVDLPIIAQLKPSDTITFEEISHGEAQLLYIEREQKLQQLYQGISLKLR
ncbi:biotin-dependent carboxyltransferase family protein [Pseudalkalibacillus caeni]|uniref:Biotin-dependent carboxyltransferase family protein n=1 Tax=Exobacillus caeni TaxID=2574798 RepID=A0A5R9F569_9BACL|nr:biotin-dependent carboxyltransferase family protein [Pseudalkalibacillus caeni]TLS38667.1 biotin-dependent carboxyltransferase family protein [Pseudalkalibacillus caeni]